MQSPAPHEENCTMPRTPDDSGLTWDAIMAQWRRRHADAVAQREETAILHRDSYAANLEQLRAYQQLMVDHINMSIPVRWYVPSENRLVTALVDETAPVPVHDGVTPVVQGGLEWRQTMERADRLYAENCK